MPDPMFRNLFEETDAMTWASMDEMRDRARRRTRRTRVAVALAAVVAVGVVSGGMAVAQFDRTARPEPGTSASVTAPASPSASPTPEASRPSTVPPSSTPPTRPSSEPTTIVDALFLQPADVGSGYQVRGGEEGSGDWTFEFATSMLNCPLSDTPVGPTQRRDRTLVRGAPQAEDVVVQYVARFKAGDAARYLDQVRARVAACRPATDKSIKISAQRFAGQDALLIKVNYGEGFTSEHVLVRQGDLLTEFFPKAKSSDAADQELGRKAALRLCGGTPVC